MANNRDEQLLKDFGNHVRKLRTDRGWSQTDLETHSRVDRVQIERIENAKINTSISTAKQLATAFGMTLSELFEFSQ
jgi:ribosome-binding protein aMBF1 (putative translation factor)